MKVRINIGTEDEPQSYLVDTDQIQDKDIRETIDFVIDNPNGTKQIGRFFVSYGTIIQQGYDFNNALHDIALEEEYPELYVITE
jgi:hypothetical protein